MSRAAVPSVTLAFVAVPSLSALVRRHPWIGALCGLGLGAFDYALLRALGVTMRLGSHDATLAICTLFALSFAGLGWAIARLLAAQAALRASAAQVADSQRRALHSEKLAEIGQLAAGVAHEVRNPLGVIRSSAAMLALDLPDGSDARRASGFIVEEVDRLNGVVRALLDYARPLATRWEAVTLAELMAAIQPLTAAALGERGVTLTARGTGEILGDPDLLAQVLLTLIDNAAQASPGGRVEVTLVSTPTAGELHVADDGPGVDPGVADRIFAPFVTTRAGGTGLGLAMAARIAEAHDGAVLLRPGAGLGPGGRGACFVLVVPRAARGGR
jgi:two-component system, NtrC family, sensor histidine kinase HydH